MIGSKIRELRKARKLSQEDLAEKISEISGESISRQSLSGWETGTVQPRTANLQAAAQALGVPLSALLDDGEAPMPSDVTPLTVPRGRMISVPLLSREVTALPMPAQARYVRSRKGGYKWIRGDRRRRRFPQNRRRRSRRRRFGVTSELTTAESR